MWAYVTGGAGLLLGLYGAIQAFLTARAVRLLSHRWRVEHFENSAFLLHNDRPRRAFDVTLALPHGWQLRGLEGDPSMVPPGGVLKALLHQSLAESMTNLVTVQWRDRHRGRLRRQTLAFPSPKIPQRTSLSTVVTKA